MKEPVAASAYWVSPTGLWRALDKKLDEALLMSFPASDPIALDIELGAADSRGQDEPAGV